MYIKNILNNNCIMLKIKADFVIVMINIISIIKYNVNVVVKKMIVESVIVIVDV